ncbi:Hypothetical predicted protein [Olea europaea subsp. europaea]|uniref:Retrotransposon Copia-like N-terminal domain-containing protein n=1 Tax=Olea europaea subsp. europaea TaxID=158383 RepID=A0A8S0VG73_OLEEU|nr:Hypothetical predicted protein [Olea europaea subsp. europaea]
MANANSNSPPVPTSESSTAVPPVQGSNHSPPSGVYLTQMLSVKLDKNTFLLWQNMILPIIKGHNLEGYILGTKVYPEFIGTQIIGDAGMVVEMKKNPKYD